jgi:hypothetical protein
MAKVDFNQLLSTNLDAVKRPPVKPAGTYLGSIASYKFDLSSQKKTPYVRFELAGIQPGEDIDPDQMKEEDGTPIDLAKWKPGFEFYLTANALFMLKEFIEGFGNIQMSGRELKEVLPELKGLPVMFEATLEQSDDGERFFNKTKNLKAVA